MNRINQSRYRVGLSTGKELSLLMAAGIALLLALSTASAQTPSCYYSFDNMDLTESSGNFVSGIALDEDGPLADDFQYDCGVGMNSSSLLFEGDIEFVSLDPEVKSLFDQEFTLSFYFRIDSQLDESYSLFSIENNCVRDSALTIRYLSVLNELRIEYARDASESVFFNVKLNEQSCWHHLVFIRNEDVYSFYLDGEFVGNQLFVEEVVLGENYDVLVGSSQCVPRLDEYFRGRVDEIKIFDFALSADDIERIDVFPDQVTSRDTTIFEGDSHFLNTGASCAPTITWTPALGLDDASIPDPIATPTESTVYQVDFIHGDCTTTDSVRVFVVTEDNIDCEQLLLASAFTPNGDGINDEYGISNAFIINELDRFQLYDRWGAKIFESMDKNDTWDGSYKNQLLMPGTYVYKIEYQCRGDNYQKTGSFNLIK